MKKGTIILIILSSVYAFATPADFVNGDFTTNLNGWTLSSSTDVTRNTGDTGYGYCMIFQNIGDAWAYQDIDLTGVGKITFHYYNHRASAEYMKIYIDDTEVYSITGASALTNWLNGEITQDKFSDGVHRFKIVCHLTSYSQKIDAIHTDATGYVSPATYNLNLTMVDADTGALLTNGYVNFTFNDSTIASAYIPYPTTFTISKSKAVTAVFSSAGYESQSIYYTDNTTATINMHSNTIAGMVKAKFTSNLQHFDIKIINESDVLKYYHSDIGYLEVNLNPDEYYNYYASSEYYTKMYYPLSGNLNINTDTSVTLNFYENTYNDNPTVTPVPAGNITDMLRSFRAPPSLPNNVYNPLEWLSYLVKLVSWIVDYIYYIIGSVIIAIITLLQQIAEGSLNQVVTPLLLNNTTKYAFYGHFWDSINNSTMESIDTAFGPIEDLRDKEIEISDLIENQQQAATNASTVYQVLFMPMLAGLPTSFKVYGVWKLTLLMVLQVMGK
jgi:hypothetical protein